MANTVKRYNGAIEYYVEKGLENLTLKLMLLNSSATFVATHTALTQVTNAGANEVHGNGWAQGGVTLSNVSVSIVDTNGAIIDADDISVKASGGAIGPASAYVIFDDAHANKIPLWFFEFDDTQTAGDDTEMKITFSANGIARITSA